MFQDLAIVMREVIAFVGVLAGEAFRRPDVEPTIFQALDLYTVRCGQLLCFFPRLSVRIGLSRRRCARKLDEHCAKGFCHIVFQEGATLAGRGGFEGTRKVQEI